jgi:hypothetical protein
MPLHTATPAALAFGRYFVRPSCPACGDPLYAPESAEFLGEGRIRHQWTCDICTYEFQTCVELGTD